MKKNIRINLLTLLIILVAGKLSGQSNYQKATVVTRDGAVLDGFVDYKEWDRNPAAFKFKATLNAAAAEKTFTPKEVTFFSIDNMDYFESHDINISQNRISLPDRIETGIDTVSKRESVFLRLISKGNRVNLYSYTDNIKPRYYIADADNKEPAELIYKRYLNQNGQFTTEEIYKSQLFALAKEYKNINNEALLPLIQNARYTLPSLTKIADCINGTESQVFALKRTKKVRFYVGANLYAGTAAYHGNDELANGAKSKISMLPGLSAGMDLYVNPHVKKVWLRFDVSFSPGNYKITKTMDGERGYIKHSFGRYTFGFTPQIIYNLYNSSAFRFNLGTGINVTYSTYSKSVYETKYTTTPGLGGSYNYSRQVKLEPFGFTIPVRTGIMIGNRFDIYAQYNIPVSAVANFIFYSIGVSTGQVGFNFML